jgi:uncharacterized coiled-coil protein SlyX
VAVITGGALTRAGDLELKVAELERSVDALRLALADERERCERRLRELERVIDSYKGDGK